MGVVLLADGVAWLLLDKRFGEGKVLLVLGGGHGVTQADLFALPALLVGLLLLVV